MAERNTITDRTNKIVHCLKWKTIIIVLLIIAIIFGVRFIRVAHLEKQLNEMKYDMKVEWFCFRECSDMLNDKNQFNICEECNTEIVEKIEEWNQNGLRSFMDWDEDVYRRLQIAIDNDTIERRSGETEKEYGTEMENLNIKKRNALWLLNGGGDIMNMDYEEFLQAVNYIETMDIEDKENLVFIGITRTQWQNMVGELIRSRR